MVSNNMTRLLEIEERAAIAFDNMGFDIRSVEAAKVKILPPELESSVVGRRRGGASGRAMGRQRKRIIDGYVLLSVQGLDGRWISIASIIQNRSPKIVGTLLFQTLILYLILLVPLVLLGRYISGPLADLTIGARNFKPGSNVMIEENGPPDTRQLIAAFNDMQARVGAMIDEKDVMLGAIGHDLRTPLSALRVRLENVEDDDERERMIAGIEDMDRTLDDILSLARLGRSGEKAESTDISALIETVVDEFSDMGEQVSFNRQKRVIARVRATLIRRALRNLIGNAVKYGDKAEVSIDDNNDGKLMIHVDDDGPGIAEEQISSMFEPFVRAEKSRNRATGGSGLGLTLARAIARDHGGDVTLQNRAGGGLRATLSFISR
ncbi:hypothetical protein MNBD_ALPHA04-112 [hydrothermal vent metagenome]|uniref:histidine kinase n=1 Tax=hydrothermal vent metagenome TaxID=652676 RepID=A0A3B0SG56_9ZZZZ